MSIPQNPADVNGREKEIRKAINENWAERKLYAKKVSAKLASVGEEKRAVAVGSCSQNIVATLCPVCGEYHAQSVFLCRDRVCPICQWRLARQRFAEMMQVLEVIATEDEEAKVTMLTLTIKNCEVGSLRETCEKMSKAWFNLFRTKMFSKVIGTARSLEITYNKHQKTFHPHYHILLFWEKGCLPGPGFLDAVAKKWSKLLKVDYKTIVDHREAYIKNKKDQNEDYPAGAIVEAFKYAFKNDTINELPKVLYKQFLSEIKGLRFVSYTGIIKKIRTALGFNEKDEPDEKDEFREIACEKCGSKCQKILYTWSCGEYVRGFVK